MNHIHQKLLINAPVEKVFQAITTQEGLAGWWTPYATARPEIGTIAVFPFGDGYFKEMEITELVPSRLLKWNCIKGDAEWIGTTLSFELEPFDAASIQGAAPEINDQKEQLRSATGTVLTFHHNDWADYTSMFAECSYTWGQFLRSIKLLCETGVGRPWPNQHSI